jgi:phosphonate metabolism protein PhnM
MIRITNGIIVTPTKMLEGFDLLIKENKIVDIIKKEEKTTEEYEVFDAESGFITPGFIDIHADYIEHLAAPRPTSLMDLSLSLHESERELITHGITTMYHSLSFYKGNSFDIKPIRKQENIRKFVELINSTHSREHLIRHRFHARYEVENLELLDELISYIRDKKVHLVSFMDHTPGQGQYRDLEIYRNTLKSYGHFSEEDIDKNIEESKNIQKISHEKIKEISRLIKENKLALASHDDDTKEKIDLVREFGTEISEFPITMEVAEYASKKGMHTVAGAPNVLLGGSHSGNLCATQAILAGVIDVLCSDYYPSSLIHAVFQLEKKHDLPLVDMINLVTLNPAKAVGIDNDYGSIEPGKIADILVIHKLSDKFPGVTTAFVNGKKVFSTHYRNK